MTHTKPLAGPQATQNAGAKHELKWKSEPDDTKVDDYYDRYKCDFLFPESLTSQNVGVPTLTNNIHPLFDEPLRKAVDNYSVVEQSARLASNFIDCGALDHIYLAIANDGSPGRSWRSKSSPLKVGLEIPMEKLDEKSPANKSKLRQLLETLCRATSFEFEEIEEHAVTDTIRDRTFREPAFPNAERSKVTINKSVYDELETAQGTGDAILIAKLQLELAVTLVHEIGHAIDNLAHGKLHHGHFLGKGIVCEPGFDIETRLLGGRLATLYQGLKRERYPRDFADQYYFNEKLSNLRGVLVIWEYPDQGMDNEYSKRKGFKTRENVKNVRHLDLAWRLPMKHVMRLFNDDFWSHEYPANPSALRPRYEVGYTFRLDQKAIIPVCKADNDTSMLYVPTGYSRLSCGSIASDFRRKTPPTVGGFVDPTEFWRLRSERYASGQSCPWEMIPDGTEDTQLLEEDNLSDPDSDLEEEIAAERPRWPKWPKWKESKVNL